jgi:hypothetical protein
MASDSAGARAENHECVTRRELDVHDLDVEAPQDVLRRVAAAGRLEEPVQQQETARRCPDAARAGRTACGRYEKTRPGVAEASPAACDVRSRDAARAPRGRAGQRVS